jgi:hypothetical protein
VCRSPSKYNGAGGKQFVLLEVLEVVKMIACVNSVNKCICTWLIFNAFLEV